MTDAELKSLFEAQREETRHLFDVAHAENAAAHAETRSLFDVAHAENAAAHAETRSLFDVAQVENAAAHAETRRLFDAAQVENAAAQAATRDVVDAAQVKNAAGHVETRRHFDIAIEAARHEIQLVAEVVVQTREDLARKTAALDDKIERATSETQAMIRFSYAELDRRVKALEG